MVQKSVSFGEVSTTSIQWISSVRRNTRGDRAHLPSHALVLWASSLQKIMTFTINKWMAKQNVIYTYNRRLFSCKNKEILAHATMWLKLVNIMLSEIGLTKKIVWVHLHEIHRGVKFIETESRMWFPGAGRWGGRRWGVIVQWVQSFSLGSWGKFWKWIVVMVAQQCECT